jgi:glutamyl-tRNA reductase
MRIGVIGINHILADLNLRERLARACQARFAPGKSLLPLVLLSTCNRTEIYFASPSPSEMHSFILQAFKGDVGDQKESLEQKLYAFFGNDCFRHLCRVTSGLDSAIVAETEIQGQVKIAYEQAAAKKILPKELHFLFQKSLKIGKLVRAQFASVRGMPALEQAIFQAAEHLFNDPFDKKLLFVGASDINLKLLSHLKKKGVRSIAICNRTEEKLIPVANKFGVDIIAWKNRDLWRQFDWIIFGTKAKEPLAVKCEGSLESRKLIIDLSVPRNVDPALGKDPNVVLLNIDQLNRMLKFRKKKLEKTLSICESIVDNESLTQTHLFQKKSEWQVQKLNSGYA